MASTFTAETTRQRKARERRESAARIAANRVAGLAVWQAMTCPECGQPVRHNNSLAGVIWLQCLPPASHRPEATGCGFQILFDRDA